MVVPRPGGHPPPVSRREVEQPEVAPQDRGDGAERRPPAVGREARRLVPGRDAVERLGAPRPIDPDQPVAAPGGRRREDQRAVARSREPRPAQAPVAGGAARRAPQHRPGRGRAARLRAGLEVESGREDLAAPREDDGGRLDEPSAAVGERQRAGLAGRPVQDAQPGVAAAPPDGEQDPPLVDDVRPAVRGLAVLRVHDGEGGRLAARRRHLQQAGAARAAEDDPAARVPRPAGRLAGQAADGGRPVPAAGARLRLRRLPVARVCAQRHRPQPAVREEPDRPAVR